jgi:hypothetical protein
VERTPRYSPRLERLWLENRLLLSLTCRTQQDLRSQVFVPHFNRSEPKSALSQSHQLTRVVVTAVCCANALKLLCICYTASIFSREKLHTKPLTTLGDALQSFLEDPDPTTKNRCQQAKQRLISKSPLFWDTDEPQEWKQCPAPWHQSPSFRRWCYTMIP